MNLYDLTIEYQNALDTLEIDPETGEVLNMDALDAVTGALQNKAEAIACYIKGLLAEGQALKAEEAALYQRRKQAEKKAERLKEYLANALLSAGMNKLKTSRCALSFRRSEQVKIIDEDALPAEYVRTEIVKKPDKTALKTALQKGAITGAELVECNNLQIK